MYNLYVLACPNCPENEGRREPGKICRKSCQLPAHHHSCDQCRTLPLLIVVMWFNKLSCNVDTIPGSSTSYLQFYFSSSRHLQLCWVLQETLILNSLELRLSAHPKLFFTNLSKCSLRLQVHFRVDKMSCVHVVLFCNLIGTARPRWQFFRGESLGMRL